MITSPGFTSYEHWSEYNDDSADFGKTHNSLINQVAKTTQGRSMQLYAEDLDSSNTSLNPESILIAREDADHNDNDYGVADYSEYEENSAPHGNLLDAVADTRESISIATSLTEDDLPIRKSKREERADIRRRDGSRQLPSLTRSKRRRSAPKELQALIMQQYADKIEERSPQENELTLNAEERLLAGKNATEEELKEWDTVLCNAEGLYRGDVWEEDCFGGQEENYAYQEVELSEKIFALRLNIENASRRLRLDYDRLVELEMTIREEGEYQGVNRKNLDKRWAYNLEGEKTLDELRATLAKLEAKLMRKPIAKPEYKELEAEKPQPIKIGTDKQAKKIASTTRTKISPLFDAEQVQAGIDRLTAKEEKERIAKRLESDSASKDGDRQLPSKRRSREMRSIQKAA